MMLAPQQKVNGVITASAGNHALALSYHGMKLGIPVTIVLPNYAAINKIRRCQEFGAKIIQKGTDLVESKERAIQMSHREGMAYVNG